ncbi:MAG: hypothetical protein R3F11_02880 [Verrucomicrobiales bacterium]
MIGSLSGGAAALASSLLAVGAVPHCPAQDAAPPAGADAPKVPGTAPAPPPKVWIFNGTPGDEAHHETYEKLLGRLRETLAKRYAIPRANIKIYYGPESAGYAGPCTREALLAALKDAAAATQGASAAPAWIIFQGHANAIPGGANFNLPGPDASAREIGEALAGAGKDAPLVAIATTACAAAFIKPIAADGRIVMAATSASDPENETEFPNVLPDVLEAPATDADGDGTVSAAEIFLACHARVRAIYENGGFMIKEHPALDGDGDGRATARPAPADAGPAARVGLRLAGKANRFD